MIFLLRNRKIGAEKGIAALLRATTTEKFSTVQLPRKGNLFQNGNSSKSNNIGVKH